MCHAGHDKANSTKMGMVDARAAGIYLIRCGKHSHSLYSFLQRLGLISPFDNINLQIDFNKRNRNVPRDVWCRMTVDGTDFKTQEPYPFNRKWMSHKYNGAALKYEVAISLYSGDIVWIYGPHRGGKADITIIREVLLRKLDQGEMVEADQGYLGEPEFIRVRDDWLTKREKKEKGRARCRHETVNGRFKNWGILKQEFRHDDKKHEWVFRTIAAITQLGIDNGNCLFASHPLAKRKESYSVDDLEF
jgi:hypothetical protein